MTDLVVTESGWPQPESRPAMADEAGGRGRVSLTSRKVLLDGAPWIPVSGEIHYSRVPRERWRERLLLMKSGGIDVVSSYVIWIHHQPEQGAPRFDGNLDIAEFVRLCAELDLFFVLRVGPWVHGEVRNGGFPDWVQRAAVIHRTDDPGYLALVREWFAALGAQLAGLCGSSGPIIAIQIENELYDQPAHLSTLKEMARAAGLTAPLYTATAWGGAELPPGEFFPLYSGYGDGFWVDADAPWDDTFRQHYFFSREWDDPGVGADVRGVEIGAVVAKARDESFPPATCELGGGMATTYHRRIAPTGDDIAAVGNAKIGSGSAWQGYYMYAGGSNPPGPQRYQESQASGYPNDLPVFDYDFHAAVGSSGALGASHAALRRQHAFLAAFGPRLAELPASLPDPLPRSVDDVSTLRWSVRSAEGSGFLFLNWHQPHIPLPPLRDLRLRIEGSTPPVVIGDTGLDILPGTIARWPFGLEVGGTRIHGATASALTLLGEDTLVLVADPGQDARISLGSPARTVVVDGYEGGTVRSGDLTVVVIGRRDAERVWVLEGAARTLALSDVPLWQDGNLLVQRASAQPDLSLWAEGQWRDVRPTARGETVGLRPVPCTRESAAREPRESYGGPDGRPAAPAEDVIAALAAEYRLTGLGHRERNTRRELRIDWAGDVAQLLVGGVVVADRFWDGSPWDLDLDILPGAEDDAVTLRILPLHRASRVHLPARAEDRRRATAGALVSVDSVTLARSAEWFVGSSATQS